MSSRFSRISEEKKSNSGNYPVTLDYGQFKNVCLKVREAMDSTLTGEGADPETALKLQKRAISGYVEEVKMFMQQIRMILAENGMEHAAYPEWYENLADAVYNENWGFSGLSEWFSEKYAQSSSAKIIGDRVYFMVKGRMKLMPQRISADRREQLIRAFLLLTPEERLDKDVHEVYLLDGTRVTIFRGGMTKTGQDVMIFRRYIIPEYSFEEQVSRGTIPKESIGLFKNMVKLGYNIVVAGAVRTSKTSFLSTWQSYEDPGLEGVMVETDPEIRLHELMPTAPVVQLIADGDRLAGVIKNLLRSDADYFILAEARDGIALDTAVKIASKGTRRMKMTFHEREPCDFCYDAAAEIVKSMPGTDYRMTVRNVAKSFDYIFHFVQLRDKSKKRLRGLYEVSFDDEKSEIRYHRICEYVPETDSWKWHYHISDDKRAAGEDEDSEVFEMFRAELESLGGGDCGSPVVRRY